MKADCEIIKDLMQMYIDGMCNDKSKAIVEEHLAECASCRTLCKKRQSDLLHKLEAPMSDDGMALEHTSRSIGRRVVCRVLGLTAIILYWLIYLWQSELSKVGDYSCFSYDFHEIYSIGMYIVPILTLVWAAIILLKIIKEHTWRKNAIMFTVLLILLFLQGNYIYNQLQVVYVSTWTEVTDIPDDYHIVIKNDGNIVSLKTIPAITSLVKADGSIYRFEYETNMGTPDKGYIINISDEEETR